MAYSSSGSCRMRNASCYALACLCVMAGSSRGFQEDGANSHTNHEALQPQSRFLLQDASCTNSTTPGYDCSLSVLNGDMTIEYTRPTCADTSVDFRVSSIGMGWVGFAWASKANRMAGSQSVIGFLDGAAGNIAVYDLNGYATTEVVPSDSFTIKNTSIEQTAAGTVLSFTREFGPGFSGFGVMDYNVAFHDTEMALIYHKQRFLSFPLTLAEVDPACPPPAAESTDVTVVSTGYASLPWNTLLATLALLSLFVH